MGPGAVGLAWNVVGLASERHAGGVAGHLVWHVGPRGHVSAEPWRGSVLVAWGGRSAQPVQARLVPSVWLAAAEEPALGGDLEPRFVLVAQLGGLVLLWRVSPLEQATWAES